MNVTMLVVELLEWDRQLKTLTYRAGKGRDLWVAHLDEYRDQRSGPFYLLDPEQEQDFARQLRERRSRTVGRYEELGGGVIRFLTEWRSISTERTALSCYALGLPPEAVPEAIEFTDPHAPGRSYKYTAMYDDQHGRIVCYLNCRSKLGFFDFDLTTTFHRDVEACRNFTTTSSGSHEPDIDFLVNVAADWEAPLVQQFFGPVGSIASDGGVAISGQGHVGPVIAGGVGTIGAIGNNAVGVVQADSSQGRVVVPSPATSAAETEGADTDLLVAGDSSPASKLAERARKSKQSQIFGLCTALAVIAATALLMFHVTDVSIASYAVAVLTLLVTLIPLFRNPSA